MIDLVVENKDGKYSVTGGPESAIFCGTGSTLDEAIGSLLKTEKQLIYDSLSLEVIGFRFHPIRHRSH
jgi:hypothetical protein